MMDLVDLHCIDVVAGWRMNGGDRQIAITCIDGSGLGLVLTFFFFSIKTERYAYHGWGWMGGWLGDEQIC